MRRTHDPLSRLATAWLPPCLLFPRGLRPPVPRHPALNPPARSRASLGHGDRGERAASFSIAPAKDQPWKPCTVGLVLKRRGRVRTGPRSMCSSKFPRANHYAGPPGGDQVLQAVRQKPVVKTDVGMKYGRTDTHRSPGGGTRIYHPQPRRTLAVVIPTLRWDDERPVPMRPTVSPVLWNTPPPSAHEPGRAGCPGWQGQSNG